MKRKTKIDDRFAKTAPAPVKGSTLTKDSEQRGFAFRVTAAGVKSFVFAYSVHGRERRMVIGHYPEWSVARARLRAKELRREVDLGNDPLAARDELRTAETVLDLWKHYEERHLPALAKRNQTDQRAMWRDTILPALRQRRLKEISHHDIDQLHAKVSRETPVRANRVVEVVRKAFNLAIRWGFMDKNPAIGVRKNQEQPRERYLNDIERARLISALEEDSDRLAANAILLIALTGARLREVLEARWEEFDLASGIWVKPGARTKQRRTHRVALSTAAIDLLKSMKDEASSAYLFPSSKGTPRSDLKRPWARIQNEAGLEDVRLHDLRHTFASILASSGVPLAVVGQQLGHTQTQTTLRYAHLYDDTLRKASQTVEAAYVAPAPNR